jgi:hypothetical protein
VKAETTRVEQREALAQETVAKARAAQAEAEAKAAEAAKLLKQAGALQEEVAISREQLTERAERADAVDPHADTAVRERAKPAENRPQPSYGKTTARRSPHDHDVP